MSQNSEYGSVILMAISASSQDHISQSDPESRIPARSPPKFNHL